MYIKPINTTLPVIVLNKKRDLKTVLQLIPDRGLAQLFVVSVPAW